MIAGGLAAPPLSTAQPAPTDTGDAVGLGPSRLTLTFGLGAGVFHEASGADRLGLGRRRPRDLRPLPGLPGDALEPERSDGDVCIQACADDPQVAFHAVRNLARIADGAAVVRWLQVGFGRDSPLEEQESPIGQHKESGAPLGGRHEHDHVDLAATDPRGHPVIPRDAHIRLAAPITNAGIRLLRRRYSFVDGLDPRTGRLDAGLFFISFQRTPHRFVEVARRLAGGDALNEYIRHTGSAVFAIPPGPGRSGFVGEGLFR